MIKIERLAAIYLPIGLIIIQALNIPKETLFFLIVILFLLEYNDSKNREIVLYMYFFVIVFMLALPYKLLKVLLSLVIVSIPVIYFYYFYLYKNESIIIYYNNKIILTTIPILSVYLFKIHLWWFALILAIIYFFYFKMDYRPYVACAIVLLIACAYILTIKPESYANKVAVIAYYMLVLGVLGAFLEYFREKEATNDSKDKIIHYERRERS